MRTELLQHEIDFYQLMGFVVLPDFLTDENFTTGVSMPTRKWPLLLPRHRAISIRAWGLSERDPQWAENFVIHALQRWPSNSGGLRRCDTKET